MSETIKLAQQLIQIDSITPEDKGCQQIIANYLQPLGFNIENMPFAEVTNLWAKKGTAEPCFVFAGHTDVVPTGDNEQWTHAPFSAHIDENNMMYGRGTADMKSAIACFMVASKRFIADYPKHKGCIAFLITSDEEGPAHNGTVKVIETLEQRGENLDYCLVGEPSSSKKLADSIKNGRRGSLSATLKIIGKQGHIAYPELAKNPIHEAMPALNELVAKAWDNGNEYFPPTSFQISNINSGTGATNVIANDCTVLCNFRFSTENTKDSLIKGVLKILDKHQLDYEIEWQHSGDPFITAADGKLIKAVREAIQQEMGYKTSLSTAGGTSDGRFIAKTCSQVIELGPLNATIHQIDEKVSVDDLEKLTNIYYKILVNLL